MTDQSLVRINRSFVEPLFYIREVNPASIEVKGGLQEAKFTRVNALCGYGRDTVAVPWLCGAVDSGECLMPRRYMLLILPHFRY